MSAKVRFAFGFLGALAIAGTLNVLSVWGAFHPPCCDKVAWGGVPFPFIWHGGFVTQTGVIWENVSWSTIAVVVISAGAGWVSNRVLPR